VADGKIYVSDDRGELAVMALAREKKILSTSRISGQFRTPTAIDGLLIVPTSRGVAAWAGPGYRKP
jgi:hypothetical protein